MSAHVPAPCQEWSQWSAGGCSRGLHSACTSPLSQRHTLPQALSATCGTGWCCAGQHLPGFRQTHPWLGCRCSPRCSVGPQPPARNVGIKRCLEGIQSVPRPSRRGTRLMRLGLKVACRRFTRCVLKQNTALGVACRSLMHLFSVWVAEAAYGCSGSTERGSQVFVINYHSEGLSLPRL